VLSAAILIVVAVALGHAVGRGFLGVLVDTRGRYSLTHLQIVLWTLVVIPLISGVFWARLLSDAATALSFAIPGELLGVLGISVGSTVAATVVKAHKDEQRRASIAASDPTRPPSLKQVFTVEEGEFADRAIDVTKFQNFWFTIILIAAYIGLCIARFGELDSVSELTSLPGFDANFVTLLGISHAGYLAGKLPDREGQPNAQTARPLSERQIPATVNASV
jgi:hypothetical protein